MDLVRIFELPRKEYQCERAEDQVPKFYSCLQLPDMWGRSQRLEERNIPGGLLCAKEKSSNKDDKMTCMEFVCPFQNILPAAYM